MAFINLGQVMYPVGSYYISNEPTSPSDLFGGQWLEIENKFLYASKGNSSVEGGSATHVHAVTLQYTPFNATLAASKNSDPDGTMIAIGDGDKTVKVETSPWKHTVCGSANSAMTTANRNPRFVTKQGNTKSTETLPPYITCHMWYRIS